MELSHISNILWLLLYVQKSQFRYNVLNFGLSLARVSMMPVFVIYQKNSELITIREISEALDMY